LSKMAVVKKYFVKKHKESLLKKSWHATKSKPLTILYIFLLDVAFLAVFYVLNLLVNSFIPQDPSFMTRVQSDTLMLVAFLLLVVAYFVMIVIIYSFFSLIVLGNIKSLSVKHKHDFSMFRRMFFLNMLLFIFFFLLLALLNIVSGLLINSATWLAVAVSIIVFIFLVMVYAFYHFANSAFILKHSVSSSLKKSIKNSVTKAYLGIMIFNAVVILLYVGLYFVLGLVFKNFIVNNYSQYVNFSSIITIILIYVLFSFNRIYFYFAAERHIGHKR
jgi:hypothetical protein